MKFNAAALALAIVIFVAGTPLSARAVEPDYTRTPVLMVHGYFPGGAAEWVTWGTFRNKLIDDGWPEEYVYAPQFKDTTGCDPDHAREVSAWVDELRTATGFDRINIVAHSEGGLNTMYYLRYFCGVHKVKNFVGLAIAVHGTWVACVDPFSCGADEMCIDMGDDGWRSNPGLVAINECDETPGDILYTSIWSDYDEIIRPPSGSELAGARNIELETPLVEHGAIFLVNESFNYMKDAFLNGTGLNTDGPGWDCIDYCIVPDLPDTAEQAEIVELPETVESRDDDAVIAELPSDTLEPGDASSDLAVAEPIPADEGGTGKDAATSDDANAGRDTQSVTDAASDATMLDARTADTSDTGSVSHSGGCGASSGRAAPVAVVILAFLAAVAARARRRC